VFVHWNTLKTHIKNAKDSATQVISKTKKRKQRKN